jgi:hypothetical protein
MAQELRGRARAGAPVISAGGAIHRRARIAGSNKKDPDQI